ncbi:expressed unknown protein [Seminavis robusta]|uniref:Uncharacterized protein n=1 Tax=Seminavis robusta TaxID=568900 RepID=A0A9N8DRN2_9STRA|nr:expressed unknown protein [Seminavis robusta]|eukprot:Sro307_g113140.1 n/a (221) ;mRNA; f:3208-3972
MSLNVENAQKLQELIDSIYIYLQYQLWEDVQWLVLQWVGPILIVILALQGLLAILRAIYKIVFPPDAPELYSTALATLHHNRRIRLDDKVHQRQAEQLLLKAIDRDDLYFPAYLSLAALYIYQLHEPHKALPVLTKAQDRGPPSFVEPLQVDAQVLTEGGNPNMLGGAMFAQQDYLSANPVPLRQWEDNKEQFRQQVLLKEKKKQQQSSSTNNHQKQKVS